MSDVALRSNLIRVASSLPKGDENRRQILALLAEESQSHLQTKMAAHQSAAFELAVAALDREVTPTTLRAVAASLKTSASKLETFDVRSLPGFSPMQMKQKIDKLAALRQEIMTVATQYETVLKQLSDLEAEEKKGVAELKEAAAQLREKGNYVLATENAILSFQAKVTDKVPGIEQMIMREDNVEEGKKAGDFFGRIAREIDEVTSKKIEIIYAQTKQDLTHVTTAVVGLKVVAKTASLTHQQRVAFGVADVVVSVKDWFSGKVDSVASKILQFAGDIHKWVKGFFVRTKMVAKASDELLATLNAAEKQINAAVK
jgi:hypothetical protein